MSKNLQDTSKAFKGRSFNYVQDDSQVLQSPLTYHIIAGEKTSADLAEGENTLSTLRGTDLTITKTSGGSVTVTDQADNTVEVTKANLKASNGVVHIINGVLKPQASSSKSLSMQSDAFQEDAMIPKVYTCDGKNISPPVQWSNVPDGTKAFALTLLDPDAPNGTFTHWLLFNIPASQQMLNKNVPYKKQLESGAKHGKNSFGDIAYGGPCPPESQMHTYVLRLYALDAKLDLQADVSKKKLLNAIDDHMLQKDVLKAEYKRK